MQPSVKHYFTCWEVNTRTSVDVPGCRAAGKRRLREMRFLCESWSLRRDSELGNVWTGRYFIFIHAEWCTWFTARCFPAFPHCCFSAELQHRQFSGVPLRSFCILHGEISLQVVKYGLFVSQRVSRADVALVVSFHRRWLFMQAPRTRRLSVT